MESTGFSRYHALSLTASKRLSRGLLFDTSYTWSKSLDTNSLNSSNFNVQDGYDIPNQYGLSDFDARHRFVLSATYQLPFTGSAWTRDWQIATIVQSQSGNPVNIVTSNATLNGVANTVRPDLVAPIRIVGSVDQWFDPASFAAVPRFGNLGRNVVIGPAFHNTDLSVRKLLTMGRYRLQLRADAFDLFNHPNLGPPGNVVGSPTFGEDFPHPPADRRSRFIAPDPAGGEVVLLMRVRLRARGCLLAAAVIAGFVPSPPLVAQTPVKRVLIIHGGPEAFPGNFDVRRGDPAVAVLAPGDPGRGVFGVPGERGVCGRGGRGAESNPSASSSGGVPSTWSSRIRRRRCSSCCGIATTSFRAFPLVFAAATVPPAVLQGTVPGVTGIVREPSQVETMDLALKLHPGTKRLHVVAYAPAVAGFRERVQATLAPFSKRVSVTYSEEPTLPEMLATLKTLPADSLIFYVRYSPVTKGRVIYPDEMLPEIVRAAPVPIYCSLDSYLGTGVVGGMMRSGEVNRRASRRDGAQGSRGDGAGEHPDRAGADQADVRLAGSCSAGASTNRGCRPAPRFASACRRSGSCTGPTSPRRPWS